MAVFTSNQDTIKTRLRQVMETMTDEAENPVFPDVESPGSVGYTLREVWARVLSSHINDLNDAMESMSPATAVGVDLDQWGQFLGMSRTRASQARGTVTAIPIGDPGEGIAITEGTIVQGAPYAMVVDEDVLLTNADESVEVRVRTRSTGDFTVSEGTPVAFSGEINVEAEVTERVSGGSTQEPDDSYRFRLSRALRAPSSFEGLEAVMLGHPDVSEVEIRNAEYGPGTAEVFVIPAVDFPPETLRADLESLASQGPSRVYVLFPTYEGISMRLRVTDTGATASKAAIVSFINNLEPGDTVRVNDVEQAARQAGLRDATVIGIRRGVVGEGRTLQSPITLKQITDVPPLDADYRWYTEPAWIQFCA